MSPTIAVVTNIDREHLDYYKGLDEIKETFLNFLDRIPFYGLAVLCLDNEPLQDLIPRIKKRYTTYGMSPQADFQARNVEFEGLRSRFSVYFRGDLLGEMILNLPGMHNVYNALAAIAVGRELNIAFEKVKSALENHAGVQRRIEIKGDACGITVVDDYGHHPTEIKTTLNAVKNSWPDRRTIVVFQPHRYTRTRALMDEFSRAFFQSDRLLVLPIYAASEARIEGVDSRILCDQIHAFGYKEVLNVESFDAAIGELRRMLQPGDIVLTLGAGDVWKVGETLLADLRSNPPAQ